MQGEIFAAEGYGKVTGEVGVCIATSGPGATNLVTGLADALLDSVPMVAITGQAGHSFTLVCFGRGIPPQLNTHLHPEQVPDSRLSEVVVVTAA